jgi:hypothetical protein
MVLLDNMPLPMLHEAVRINAGRAILEISGGVTLEACALCRNRRGPHLHWHADQGRQGHGLFHALASDHLWRARFSRAMREDAAPEGRRPAEPWTAAAPSRCYTRGNGT